MAKLSIKQGEALSQLWEHLADQEHPVETAAWIKSQMEQGTLASPHLDWDVMGHTLDKRQFECIPCLHQAGWTLKDTPESWRLLGKAIAVGDWPYPDLIAPDCMERKLVHGAIGPLLMVNMLFHPNKPWEAHLQRLAELDRDGHLVGKLSVDMGGLADMSQIDDLPYDCLNGRADFMLEKGWIQPLVVLEVARNKLHGHDFCQWFSGVVARKLDGQAPQASQPGRTLRL